MGKEIPLFFELEIRDFSIDGTLKRFQVGDYITAKTKDLIEFGYNSLTEEQVKASLWRCVSGEIDKSNVIDHFINSDLP